MLSHSRRQLYQLIFCLAAIDQVHQPLHLLFSVLLRFKQLVLYRCWRSTAIARTLTICAFNIYLSNHHLVQLWETPPPPPLDEEQMSGNKHLIELLEAAKSTTLSEFFSSVSRHHWHGKLGVITNFASTSHHLNRLGIHSIQANVYVDPSHGTLIGL